MAAALPESADASCERIRLAFRSWAPQEPRPPECEAVLTCGQSNIALLLVGVHGRWVLRIPRGPAPIGVCRGREVAVHRRAAAAGLAPPLRFADPASGILVTDYVVQGAHAGDSRGASYAAGCARERHISKDTGGLLRAIHRLIPTGESEDVYGPPLDSVQRLRRWRRSLAGADPLEALGCTGLAALDEATARLGAETPTPVLCHNDLLAANRLRYGDGLIAIDWEYACLGDGAFDLAVSASELDDGEAGDLLNGYLERSPTAKETQRFLDQRLVYFAIASCWYAAQRKPRAAVAASLEALRRRCDPHGSP